MACVWREALTETVSRRAIVPIGVMFSLTLICGNLAYLTLSVSFIQMLKVSRVMQPVDSAFDTN